MGLVLGRAPFLLCTMLNDFQARNGKVTRPQGDNKLKTLSQSWPAKMIHHVAVRTGLFNWVLIAGNGTKAQIPKLFQDPFQHQEEPGYNSHTGWPHENLMEIMNLLRDSYGQTHRVKKNHSCRRENQLVVH